MKTEEIYEQVDDSEFNPRCQHSSYYTHHAHVPRSIYTTEICVNDHERHSYFPTFIPVCQNVQSQPVPVTVDSRLTRTEDLSHTQYLIPAHYIVVNQPYDYSLEYEYIQAFPAVQFQNLKQYAAPVIDGRHPTYNSVPLHPHYSALLHEEAAVMKSPVLSVDPYGGTFSTDPRSVFTNFSKEAGGSELTYDENLNIFTSPPTVKRQTTNSNLTFGTQIQCHDNLHTASFYGSAETNIKSQLHRGEQFAQNTRIQDIINNRKIVRITNVPRNDVDVERHDIHEEVAMNNVHLQNLKNSNASFEVSGAVDRLKLAFSKMFEPLRHPAYDTEQTQDALDDEVAMVTSNSFDEREDEDEDEMMTVEFIEMDVNELALRQESDSNRPANPIAVMLEEDVGRVSFFFKERELIGGRER